jgi:hypothetical protein
MVEVASNGSVVEEQITLEMIAKDPERYQWQEVETDGGHIMMLCDMHKGKDNKPIATAKPFVKEKETNGNTHTVYSNKKTMNVIQK